MGGEEALMAEHFEHFFRRLSARNYGCLREVDIDLTPLHAFIGPNDSGKSTILDAARAIVEMATYVPGEVRGSPAAYPLLKGGAFLGIKPTEHSEYRIWKSLPGYEEELWIGGKQYKVVSHKEVDEPKIYLGAEEPPERVPDRWVPIGVRLVRLDPDAMRAASPLIPDTEPVFFADERGTGLASVFDALRNRSDDDIRSVSDKVRELFPSVKGLRMINTDNLQKAIAIEIEGGTIVPAERMSEGLLYFLGFAALELLEPVSLLLVEEPENGLHPARIMEIVKVLRSISTKTQVLIATHSPLVINELQPEEVTVVTRDPAKGTQIHPIKDTPNFKERSKVYALGELWLSYADGDMETRLLRGEPSQ